MSRITSPFLDERGAFHSRICEFELCYQNNRRRIFYCMSLSNGLIKGYGLG